MEICSDQQFEDLGQESQAEGINSEINEYEEQPEEKQLKVYSVKIVPLQITSEMNFFEKQEYSVNIFKKDQIYSKDLKRRFSDFDLFFNALFRQYRGYLLPAFPQKDLTSFVKTKVSYSKDEEYLKVRMKMLQRFLEILLNSQKFNEKACSQTKQFLHDNQFQSLKEEEKVNNQGLISSSWNKLMNYVKLGKDNKYKVFSEEINEKKQEFMSLYQAVKQMSILIDSEIKNYKDFSQNQVVCRKFRNYCQFVSCLQSYQAENLEQLKELEFKLQCQNFDFMMVLKTIDNIEESKNMEIETKQLSRVDSIFQAQYKNFKKEKDQSFKNLHISFCQILKSIKVKDQQFRNNNMSSNTKESC